jgi:hypothetical protein
VKLEFEDHREDAEEVMEEEEHTQCNRQQEKYHF